jgi:hypothetical protein
VNPDAASHFVQAKQQRLALVVNAANYDNFTADSFARHVWPKGDRYLIPIGACRTLSDIEEVMRQQICSKVSKAMSKNTKLGEQFLKTTPVPIVLIFPSPEEDESIDYDLPDTDMLQELMSKYPNTAIFIPSRNNLLEGRQDMQILEPPLDQAEEGRQYINYCHAINYIDRNIA